MACVMWKIIFDRLRCGLCAMRIRPAHGRYRKRYASVTSLVTGPRRFLKHLKDVHAAGWLPHKTSAL